MITSIQQSSAELLLRYNLTRGDPFPMSSHPLLSHNTGHFCMPLYMDMPVQSKEKVTSV